MKKEDALKPYDAKKSVWVPDGEGGFDEALIDSVDGDKVNVKVGWEPKTFKSAQVMQVNPPKMEKFEDVSNMTYLNEAAVLWNLKSRYVSKLIYTYSGLFCVVINPYKRYPIYTERTCQMYIGKRRNEVKEDYQLLQKDMMSSRFVALGSSSSVCCIGRSLRPDDEQQQRPVDAHHWRVGSWKDREHKKGDHLV